MADPTPPTYEEVQAEMIRQMGGPTPQPTSGDDQPRWTFIREDESASQLLYRGTMVALVFKPHPVEAIAAALNDHAAVTQERDVLRDKLEAWLNGPPSQMSYRGRLVPINSTGMREVIDENARLWEFVRAYDATCEGPNHGPTGCVDGLIAARATLGDTP